MKKIIFLLVIVAFIMVPAASLAQTNTNENINTNVNINSNTNTNTNTNTNVVADDDSNKVTNKESDAEAIVEDPGILPDNPLYTLKSWWEEVQLFFTFNSEHKAELQQRFALRKIAEAKKMVEKGKTDLAAKQLQRASRYLEKFQVQAEKLTNVSEDKKDELIAKLELIQAKQQEVLMDVYDQVPDQAQDAILDAIEKSSHGIETAIENVHKSEAEVDEFHNSVKQRIENHGSEMKLEIKEKLQNRGFFNDDEEDGDTEEGDSSEDEIEDSSNSNENINSEDNDDHEDDNINSEESDDHLDED